MGLTTWKDSPNGKILKRDIGIAKNYLNKSELTRLNRLVTMFIDYAELMAEDGILMSMQKWLDQTNQFLINNRRKVLSGKGHVSHEDAMKKAEEEYEEFRIRQDREYISDFVKANMLREKYLDFLNFISNDLSKLGFVKKRKKEVFYCEINNKIKKIEFIMIKRRDIGEIVVNVSVEYPKLNELITKVAYHNFKRNNIFSTYICNLPDVNQTSDFVFCDDTNMAYLSEMVAVLLENKVIPYLMEFDNDITIIKMFEYNNRIMSALYSSKGKLVTDYYLIWAGLCILNNLCCEATMIMHHAMSKVEESDIKGYLTEIEELTKCREQKNAWYLKTPKEEIFIDPSIKEIKEFLYALDGKVHSYIIIVNSITHNYIQIAGASGEFIVEVREHNGNDYKHYRYKKKTEDNSKRNLPFQGGFMQVRVNEIVNFKEILKVLNYLKNEYIISENYWEDITDNI